MKNTQLIDIILAKFEQLLSYSDTESVSKLDTELAKILLINEKNALVTFKVGCGESIEDNDVQCDISILVKPIQTKAGETSEFIDVFSNNLQYYSKNVISKFKLLLTLQKEQQILENLDYALDAVIQASETKIIIEITPIIFLDAQTGAFLFSLKGELSENFYIEMKNKYAKKNLP